MIGLPLFEMWRGQVEAEVKSEQTKKRFTNIEDNIDGVVVSLDAKKPLTQ